MRAAPIAVLLLGLMVVPAACSSSDDATPAAADAGTDTGTVVVASDAGSSSDAGSDGAVPKPPPPAGCVEDADAKSPEAAPCVTDSFAVFADASAGTDKDDGSQAHPKKTLTAALAAAKAANKQRVYLCGAGPYQEHVTFEFGTRVIGGFACGSWKYDGTRARIAPTDAGPAVRASKVADAIELSDLEVQAFDIKAKADGSSSIGVFAVKSILRLTRVTVTAYDGAVGKNGGTGAPGVYKTSNTNADGDANAIAWAICTCNGGESTNGGSGENLNNTGQFALPGQPTIVAGHGAGGGATTPGQDGDPGASGTDGLKSNSIGVLSETDWLPHAGDDGVSSGKVGQGGGGGGCGSAIATCVTTTHAMGSGGGCGGCGGSPGKGGTGGGSSLAIVLIDTALTANESSLTAGAGARGGDGGSGGSGATGGKPGTPSSGTSLPGHGGKGGPGGGGAGGAGGLSAGILYRGAAPIIDASTLSHITIGAAGGGGTHGGLSIPLNNGASGKADKLLDYNTL